MESILRLLKCLKIRAQATQAGGIDFLESILGLLKSLKFGLRYRNLHFRLEIPEECTQSVTNFTGSNENGT